MIKDILTGLALGLAFVLETRLRRHQRREERKAYRAHPLYCAHCDDQIRTGWGEVHYYGCPHAPPIEVEA